MSGCCALIDRQRKSSESRVLLASYIRQVDRFSRPGATSSSLRRFPVVLVSVIFGQLYTYLYGVQILFGQ